MPRKSEWAVPVSRIVEDLPVFTFPEQVIVESLTDIENGPGLLRPPNNENIALPPDDELIGDLTAPHWKVTSAGKIQIESKDDIRKRLGRSTDTGDPVVMAFHEEAEESGLELLDEEIADAICNYRGGREDYDPPYGPWATGRRR
ncbi:MAG: hypothetical protein H0W28_07030 [Pyrinomonadaceae bacterium]|nr:hypothetical protein [Pyrinomonadaceae bacterium]